MKELGNGWALVLILVANVAGHPAGAETVSVHHDLQVLPSDISRDELMEVMLENLRGLGLPRRAGEGCLYCHAGSLDVPRGQWDYASDDNPMKAKARTMMAMVREINERHLAGSSNNGRAPSCESPATPATPGAPIRHRCPTCCSGDTGRRASKLSRRPTAKRAAPTAAPAPTTSASAA